MPFCWPFFHTVLQLAVSASDFPLDCEILARKSCALLIFVSPVPDSKDARKMFAGEMNKVSVPFLRIKFCILQFTVNTSFIPK